MWQLIQDNFFQKTAQLFPKTAGYIDHFLHHQSTCIHLIETHFRNDVLDLDYTMLIAICHNDGMNCAEQQIMHP